MQCHHRIAHFSQCVETCAVLDSKQCSPLHFYDANRSVQFVRQLQESRWNRFKKPGSKLKCSSWTWWVSYCHLFTVSSGRPTPTSSPYLLQTTATCFLKYPWWCLAMQRMSFPFNNNTTHNEVLSERKNSLEDSSIAGFMWKEWIISWLDIFLLTQRHTFLFFCFCSSCTCTVHIQKDTCTFMHVPVCDSFRLLPTAAVWYFKVGVIMLSWNRGSPWGGLWAGYLHTVWTFAPIVVVALKIVSNNPPSARKTTNLTKYLIAALLSSLKWEVQRNFESGTFVFSI